MPDSLHQLLAALEEITAKAECLVGPRDGVAGDLDAVHGLIHERGVLIGKLPEVISDSAPISYSDYNRIGILHLQGDQISGRLRGIRDQLALQVASGTAQRAYRDCLSGMVSASEVNQVDTA
jgi:hypothetical protein